MKIQLIWNLKKNLPKRLNIVKKATGTLFREEIENIVVSEIVNQFYKKMNNMMQFLILPEKTILNNLQMYLLLEYIYFSVSTVSPIKNQNIEIILLDSEP